MNALYKSQVLTDLSKKHPDICCELIEMFEGKEHLCEQWLSLPKRPLQYRSPIDQLKIDAESVRDMLERMKTGDFS
ncbi:hypothetical protein ST37_10075 [Vibrio sp. qd031]|uniref:MbcA/ParS/Xre antitoxin family protein n=1 Tax=Vibrio sp. qd031 TaxID=1603038 RepID=UPI000A10B878|nr:MbcA/ParS/Xre antitoxin family protein [Vibrio sp. qd031]ORT50234.1 hypothetical protein ST37_10075 [Vibrio sp. qd031]